MGFPKVLMQDWNAASNQDRRDHLAQLIGLKIVLSVVVIGVAVIADYVVRGADAANPIAVLLAGCAIAFESLALFIRTPDQAQQRWKLETFVPGACRLLTLFLLFLFSGKLEHGYQIAALYLIANFVGILLSLPALREFRPRFSMPKGWMTYLKRGMPFSFTGIFVMISLYIDSVMLGRYSLGEVGHYNAAYRVILVAVALSAGVCHGIFPRIVSLREKADYARASQMVGGALRVFLLLGIAMALGGMLIGEELMTLLYGDEFQPSGMPFVILCLLIPLSAAANIIGHALEAGGDQQQVMWINLRSACFNVVANLLLIPRYGMLGAAFTTVLTEAATIAQMTWCLRRETIPTVDPTGLWRIIPFAAVIAGGLFLLKPMHLFLQIALGAVIVLAVSAGLRRVWFADLPNFKEPV